MRLTKEPITIPLIRHSDWGYLAVACCWAIALQLFIISQTVCIARDGVDYIQFAFYLQREPWPTVWRESAHHPLYPLAIAAFHRLFFAGRDLEPETWQTAAQGVNFLASLLAIPAVYTLSRNLVGPRIAFGITVLYHTLPGLARCHCDALSEPLYLTGITWCLALAIHGWLTKRIRYFLSSGLACAIAYWVRPEAIILAAAIILMLVVSILVHHRLQSTKWALVTTTMFTLTFALTVAPYCYVIGGLTVKSSAHQIVRSLTLNMQPNLPYSTSVHTASLCLLGHSTYYSAIALLLEKIAQGFFYIPLVFVIPGFMLALRKSMNQWPWALISFYMLLHLVILCRGALVLGYATERYTYPITTGGLVCAGLAWRHSTLILRGLCFTRPNYAAFVRKLWLRVMYSAFLAFIALCVAKLVTQPLHLGAAGHREAGYWLRQHMLPGDNLFDPYGLAAFYSGHLLVWSQQYAESVGTFQGNWWIILNTNERDHRVKEKIVAFSEIAAEAFPVFWSASKKNNEVVIHFLPGPVYKLSPLRGRYYPRVR